MVLDQAVRELETHPEDADQRRHRFYAQWYASTEPGWDKTIAETEALLNARDKARNLTTLDAVQWLRRGPTLSVVYFLGFNDLIKIGTSVDVPARIQALSLPPDCLLASEPGAFKRESELHAQFAEHRVHGEWFRRAPELLAYIDGLSAGGQPAA